jgi:integrase/recombinase XerD
MKKLNEHLEEYLALRHKIGFKLRVTGGLLHQFVRFANRHRATFVTTRLALRWATQPAGCQPFNWASRLGMVRRFAQYLSLFDPRTEIPPAGLLPHHYHRKSPYIYRDEEVVRLIEKAKGLPSPKGLRGATFSTLFGLLAATGLRVEEAIRLDRDCVDLRHDLITVRYAKGHRTRLVPIHPSTRRALKHYQRLRDRVCPQPSSLRFLVNEYGMPLTYHRVRYWFIRTSRQSGLRGPHDRHGPRIHDLRHRFAIQTLLRWYRTNLDVEAHLPELATYLGHRHVTGTFWYISAAPELLQLATRRWERAQGGFRR